MQNSISGSAASLAQSLAGVTTPTTSTTTLLSGVANLLGTTTDDLISRAQFPVEKMQPAMQHFWRKYAELKEIPAKSRSQKLERSVRCAAARMIQTAYEYMYYQPQVSTNVLYLLQVSLNILTRPQEAIAELLGFPGDAHV